MSMTDPIADYLTIIRNGCKANFKHVDVPASKIKKEISKVLLNQGYIKRFIVIDIIQLLPVFYQLAFVTPGISPMSASSLKQILHNPNFRKYPLGLPQRRQR